MEKMMTVLEIIVPIFVTIFMGMIAKRKNMISAEQNQGLQNFVTKFGLPCVLFNSCLTAHFGVESVTSMVLLLPLIFLNAVWSHKVRRKQLPYYNLPILFSAQESGMLGIPLFLTLFGAQQVYRMAVLDITQAFVAIPVIAMLAAGVDEKLSVLDLVKKVFRSPLLLLSILGLTLNLSGMMNVLNEAGVGTLITETTGFLAQPVSAVILFSVGYNFSLAEGNRKEIFKICILHFSIFAVFCALIQGAMCFLPNVEMETRIAILIYCTLPPSFLSPGFGKNEEEFTISSGVSSILTVVSLLIFCLIAAVTA